MVSSTASSHFLPQGTRPTTLQLQAAAEISTLTSQPSAWKASLLFLPGRQIMQVPMKCYPLCKAFADFHTEAILLSPVPCWHDSLTYLY